MRGGIIIQAKWFNDSVNPSSVFRSFTWMTRTKNWSERYSVYGYVDQCYRCSVLRFDRDCGAREDNSEVGVKTRDLPTTVILWLVSSLGHRFWMNIDVNSFTCLHTWMSEQLISLTFVVDSRLFGSQVELGFFFIHLLLIEKKKVRNIGFGDKNSWIMRK